MKKVFVTLLAVIMLFCISINTFAASTPKTIDVKISAPVKAQSGEVVTLTAVTLKHGSDFKDEWVGATKVSTVLSAEGYYISTARVTARESMTVQYNIEMYAGNSVIFDGKASTSVDVDKAVTVVGAEVINVNAVTGAPNFYFGNKYAILSNGTKVSDGICYFWMSGGSGNISTYVVVDNVRYDFIVPVSI